MRFGIKRLPLAILENLEISYFVYKLSGSRSIFFIFSRIISSRQDLDFSGILLSDLSESIVVEQSAPCAKTTQKTA
jgi:hypothetical protein